MTKAPAKQAPTAAAAASDTRRSQRSATVYSATSEPSDSFRLPAPMALMTWRRVAPKVITRIGSGAIRRATSGTVWSRSRLKLNGSRRPASGAPLTIATSDRDVRAPAIRASTISSFTRRERWAPAVTARA
jgi:hypothetical protein